MFILRFQGGFANQLFQYAFYLKLIEEYPFQDIYVDLRHYKKCKDHGGFKLNQFVDLNVTNAISVDSEVINENNYEYFVKNFSQDKFYYFDGYWQNKSFFPKNLEKIRKIFDKSNLLKCNEIFLKKIDECNSVSIHVRRGDYVNNFMHGNIANKCYLQNSIDYIKSNVVEPVFFVFSDDIKWTKDNLNFVNSEVFFISGNDKNVEQDIILMSNCKHNIISNSSFSWWAQYLNNNPQKLVITPEYWFNQKTETVEELFVDKAIKIPNTPKYEKVNKKPFFSIIIPVYNTKVTLRRTLASVLNQSYDNIEVIIVDDCSTDNSYEILKAYEVRDKRIKLFHHEKNSGSLVTRLTGMRQAKGQYILFLDSDDWLELEACQVLFDELNKNPVDILEFGYINEPFGKKNPMPKIKTKFLKAIFSISAKKRYPVTFWNKAYSREVLQRMLPYTKEFYCTMLEDGYFTILFLTFYKTFYRINKYLHHYNSGTGITTQKNYTEEKICQILDSYNIAFTKIYEFLREKNATYTIAFKNFVYYEIQYICGNFTRLHIPIEQKISNLYIVKSYFNNDYVNNKISEFILYKKLFHYMASGSYLKKIAALLFYIFFQIKLFIKSKLKVKL